MKKKTTPMNFIYKVLTILCVTFATVTLQDQVKTIKIKELISVCDTKGKRKIELLSTSAFLSRHNETAVFSPFCLNLKFFFQIYRDKFKYESLYQAERNNNLDAIHLSVKIIKGEKLPIANDKFPPDYIKSKDCNKFLDNYVNYNPDDSGEIYKKHVSWVKKETKGLISSPLKKEDFEGVSRIFCSIVYFRDFYKYPFRVKNTNVSTFTLRNGQVVDRKYMNCRDSFKYKDIKSNFGDFHIVAIPYGEEFKRGFHKRYMVYLIPKDTKTSPENLWEAFNSEFKNGISEMILNLEEEELNLSIPKIEKLTSELNMCNIFPEIYKFKGNFYVQSKMKTYLQLDEEGTKAANLMPTTNKDHSGHYIPVTANIPHIAFGYNVFENTIMFVLKDEGPKEN